MPHLSIPHLCPQLSARIVVLAVFLAASCVTAFSAGATVSWDAVPRTDIAGYKIHYQGASNSDVRSIDVGNVTTYKFTGLSPDTYYFCVTAYDLSGNESPRSNVVSISIPRPMYGFRDGGASLSVAQLASCRDQHERFRELRMNFSAASNTASFPRRSNSSLIRFVLKRSIFQGPPSEVSQRKT